MTHEHEMKKIIMATGAADLLVHLSRDANIDAGAFSLIMASYGRYVYQTQGRRVPTNPATYVATGESL